VVMPELPEPKFALRQAFLVAALLLALGFTLFAGYLLRRDVQRDLRAAELRAQFVSSVTHELKTPLTAIRMFSETLRLDADMDRETRQEYLDTILHESERLSRLVDNILEFGKIERGRKTYRFNSVRLDEVVAQAPRNTRSHRRASRWRSPRSRTCRPFPPTPMRCSRPSSTCSPTP
jgi:signal transduction histidine kinase